MSGHSKWATIKRKKGAADAARGAMFGKLIKEIGVAARLGGPDAASNARLRVAIDKAKANSMPKATIERCIAKATGEGDSAIYETVIYEGFGTAGVAILVECLTDNRNRTAAEVRHAFAKGGGNLGAAGSVSYQFKQKGIFTLTKEGITEDAVMEAVLEGGGDDVEDTGDEWQVTSPFGAYDTCKKALEALGVEVRAELTQIPDNTVTISADDAAKLDKLLERIEELDDVQETYTNAEIAD